MKRLKNLLELFIFGWKLRDKKYLILTSTTNESEAQIFEAEDVKGAYRKAVNLVRDGKIQKIRIVVLVGYMDLLQEIENKPKIEIKK